MAHLTLNEWHTTEHQKSKLRLEARRESQRLRRNLEVSLQDTVQTAVSVAEIEQGDFRILPALFSDTTIQECSRSYMEVVAQQGNHSTKYGYHDWTISRNYIQDAQVLDKALGPSFEPLLQASQEQVESILNHPVEIDSACGHLYDADTPGVETGSSWVEHRDYTSDESLACASIIVQGHTREGFDGGGVSLRVGESKTFVQLDSGDALLLQKTWHLPHAITRGRRLVFVLFFSKAQR